MLKALYDYGMQHGLALPPGYVYKPIKAYISLSHSGDFLGFMLPEKGESVPCPDIGSLANGTDKCNVLAEKLSVLLPDRPNAKTDFFVNALEDGSAAEPALALCLGALKDENSAAAIRREASAHKLKASDRLSFRVDGKSVLNSPRVMRWWTEYRRQFIAGDDSGKTLCLITGEPTVPLVTVPKVTGLRAVGGHSSGDALICFDKNAFCSYGLKQGANAPVSEEAFVQVKAALDSLLAKAPILAGMKFVHWYDKPVSDADDPVKNVFAGASEDEDGDEDEDETEEAESETTVLAQAVGADRQFDRVVESVESGEQASPLANVYYILLLTGVGGRVMVRRYEHGSFRDLQTNIRQWQEDLEISNLAGTGRAKLNKLTAMLIRLLSRKKHDSKVFERLGKELAGVTPAVITAILTGGPLPDAVASRALAYIRSQMTDNDDEVKAPPIPDAMCCQWLKAWLLRRARKNDQEECLVANYNPDNVNPAYHCGAIMAVYADVQRTAMPDVNAGIIQRYYSSASQTPALAMGQLQRLSNHHLAKIESGWLIRLYEDLLNTAYAALGDKIPVTLDLEQQAYFALGYRQMAIEMNRKKNERKAEYDRNRARKTDDDQADNRKEGN